MDFACDVDAKETPRLRLPDDFNMEYGVRIGDFPIRVKRGVWRVCYELIELRVLFADNDPTLGQMLDLVSLGSKEHPDLVRTRVFLRNFPGTHRDCGDSPIISLCGSVSKAEGGCRLAYLVISGDKPCLMSDRGVVTRRRTSRLLVVNEARLKRD